MSLDWLADAGLNPAVHARLVELEASLWAGTLDDTLLRLVRVRAAQLIGAPLLDGDDAVAEVARSWPTSPELDARGRTVLRWAEQFVIDPHGITDEDAAALRDALDPRQCGELTTAIAVFEALARTRVALAAT